MKKLIIIVILFLSNCGYQPIYFGENKDGFIFKDIKIIGDKNINNKVISTLNLTKGSNNETVNEIIIESSKIINEISKDKKGRISSYRTTLNINLTIKDNDKVIKEKNFTEDFSYNNMDNKFDLAVYQNDVENNLIKKIIEEIIIFLKL